jgi:hypothetical protein
VYNSFNASNQFDGIALLITASAWSIFLLLDGTIDLLWPTGKEAMVSQVPQVNPLLAFLKMLDFSPTVRRLLYGE